MKNYVATTAVVFGLLVPVHLWRAAVEGVQVFRDPGFDAATLVAAGLCAWGCRLLWAARAR